MPALTTDYALTAISGSDGSLLQVTPVGHPTLLPRVGVSGTFVDLSYLRSVQMLVPSTDPAEVWLGPGAPADAVARLRAAGLTIQGVTYEAQQRQQLETSGSALALRFHLAAAGLGVLLAVVALALVAIGERRRRAEDLMALRRQGLPRRFVRRAALWGYLSLVVGAVIAGGVAAAVAWLLAGSVLPIFGAQLASLPTPKWPDLTEVARAWAVVGVVMIAGAVAGAWALRAAVRSGTARSGTATPPTQLR
jgi:hypothetical protein